MVFDPRLAAQLLEAGPIWKRGREMAPCLRAGAWTIHWRVPSPLVRQPEFQSERPEYQFPANREHPDGYIVIFRGYQVVAEGIVMENRFDARTGQLLLWLERDDSRGEAEMELSQDDHRAPIMLDDFADEHHQNRLIPVRHNERPHRTRSWISISRDSGEIRFLRPPGSMS